MILRQRETCGHYADYGVVVSTEHDGFSNGLWVAVQKIFPERIAHDDDARATLDVFFWGNEATEHRRNPKGFKEPGVDIARLNLHGFSSAGVVHVFGVDRAALREGVREPLDIDDVQERVGVAGGDKLLGILVGQWIE